MASAASHAVAPSCHCRYRAHGIMTRNSFMCAHVHAGTAAVLAAPESPRASVAEDASAEEAPAADVPDAELLARQSAPAPNKEVEVAGTEKEPDRRAHSHSSGVWHLLTASVVSWASGLSPCVGCAWCCRKEKKAKESSSKGKADRGKHNSKDDKVQKEEKAQKEERRKESDKEKHRDKDRGREKGKQKDDDRRERDRQRDRDEDSDRDRRRRRRATPSRSRSRERPLRRSVRSRSRDRCCSSPLAFLFSLAGACHGLVLSWAHPLVKVSPHTQGCNPGTGVRCWTSGGDHAAGPGAAAGAPARMRHGADVPGAAAERRHPRRTKRTRVKRRGGGEGTGA